MLYRTKVLTVRGTQCREGNDVAYGTVFRYDCNTRQSLLVLEQFTARRMMDDVVP